MAHSDLGFLDKAEALLEKVRSEQAENISKATDLMVEAIRKDECAILLFDFILRVENFTVGLS